MCLAECLIAALGDEFEERLAVYLGETEDFLTAHAQFLADFVNLETFVEQLLDDVFHGLQQVSATCTVECHGAGHIVGGVIMGHDDYGYFATEHCSQRLLPRYHPTMEAVNDGVIGADHDGETEAVVENTLGEQVEVLLQDLVGVVVIRLDEVSVYELQIAQRREEVFVVLAHVGVVLESDFLATVGAAHSSGWLHAGFDVITLFVLSVAALLGN